MISRKTAPILALFLCLIAFFRPALAVSSSAGLSFFEEHHRTNGVGDSCLGAVLLVPGLNLNPNRLDSVARGLNLAGYRVLRVALQGHDMADSADDRARRFYLASANTWREQIWHAYQMLREEAVGCHDRIHLVAYSLGALVTLSVMKQHPLMSFRSAVLLAPAITPKPWGRWMSWLPLPDSFVFPSLSPKYYRANSGTPIHAYHVLFGLVDEVSAFTRMPVARGTVLMSEDDELVDYTLSKIWVNTVTPGDWELVPVKKASDAATSIEHLIIDPFVLGQRTWQNMMKCVVRTLASQSCTTSLKQPGNPYPLCQLPQSGDCIGHE